MPLKFYNGKSHSQVQLAERSRVHWQIMQRKGEILTHKELVDIAEKWLLKAKGCGFSFGELCAFTSNSETPDAIGWRGEISILVECKASKSDFISDKKKPFRIEPDLGMGTFRFYMCPSNVIKPEDLPPRWGLVWVNEKGKALQKVGPKGNCSWNSCSEFYHVNKSYKSEADLMCSALRRLHLRDLLKTIYEPDNFNEVTKEA